MMNLVDRRSFLVRMVGGATALALMPQIDAVAALHPSIHPDEVSGPSWDAVHDAVMEEAWQGFVSKVGRFSISSGVPLVAFSERDGYRFEPLAVTMRHNMHARAAGEIIGARCSVDNTNVFAAPELPKYTEIARHAHGVLRYIKAWDPLEAEYFYHLCVLRGVK